MSGKLYALLVGINDYPEPSRPLGGCVNDVLAMKSYLEVRTGSEGGLALETLIDAEATRERVIATFRSHLGGAGTGDVALFFYAGHGSQESAPLKLAEMEPDGLCETLRLHDSRQPGQWDLADKELAVLIAEVAQRGPHVVVILDSCHSGSATRVDEKARQVAARKEPRPLETYWFWNESELPSALGLAGGWRVLPYGRHVLLTACEDYQLARECISPTGEKRGLFSYFLLDTLSGLTGAVTYRDLFKQVQALVTNSRPDQTPQAEGDLGRLLLDGAVAARRATYFVRRRAGGWDMDAGAVHGIQAGAELAVFRFGAEELEDLSRKLADARVTEVGAARSNVTLQRAGLPEEYDAFPGVLTRLPFPPMKVAVETRNTESAPFLRAIEDSPFLELCSDSRQAEVSLLAERSCWRLRRPTAGGDLVLPFASPEGAFEIVGVLEHIARWQTTLSLRNPGSPLAGAIEMTVYEWRAETDGEPKLVPFSGPGELRIPYREAPGRGSVPGRFAVRLRNTRDRPLYYSLLALSEAFAVQVLREGSGRLTVCTDVVVRGQDGVPVSVPDIYYTRGVTQRRDVLLLLVSDVEPDVGLLEQGSLHAPYLHRGCLRGGERPRGLLDTLMWRVGWREADEPDPLVANQWAVERVAIVAERPAPLHRLDGSGGRLRVADGVWIEVPPGLVGTLRLHNAHSAHRSCPALKLPAAEAGSLRRLALAGEVGSDPGLSAIELRRTKGIEAGLPGDVALSANLELESGEVPVVAVSDGATSQQLELIPSETVPGSWLLPVSSSSTRSEGERVGGGLVTWLELYAERRQ
jgi:hypothetical protein